MRMKNIIIIYSYKLLYIMCLMWIFSIFILFSFFFLLLVRYFESLVAMREKIVTGGWNRCLVYVFRFIITGLGKISTHTNTHTHTPVPLAKQMRYNQRNCGCVAFGLSILYLYSLYSYYNFEPQGENVHIILLTVADSRSMVLEIKKIREEKPLGKIGYG